MGFDFEDKYDYLVKLSKIGDSTRYIIGRNENNEPCYYTELNLTFEVQGEACARARYGYEFKIGSTDNKTKRLTIDSDITDYITSDLNFPFVLNASIIPIIDSNNTTSEPSIKADLIEYSQGQELTRFSLFNIIFQDLAEVKKWTNDTDGNFTNVEKEKIDDTYGLYNFEVPVDENIGRPTLNIRYDSESGLLFLKVGESTEKILSLVNSINGVKIVNNFNASKCKLPGRFTKPDIANTKYSEYVIEVTINDAEFPTNNNEAVNISAYARTNLI